LVEFLTRDEKSWIEVKNFELHVSWVVPDKAVSKFFNVDEDQKLLKLERLRGKKR
jgi:GntR family transcriptional regulator